VNKSAPRESMPVTIKTSYNLPPAKVIRHDIEELRASRRRAVDAIHANEASIAKQHEEQAQLRTWAEDPGDYNPKACSAAADRCDKHVAMFNALIDKEHAKIRQLDHMIAELERRLCLSELT